MKKLEKIKLSRNYPTNPIERYSKDPSEVDDICADMDAAICEPVSILEDVLGYAAYSSCEGHEVHNPYVKKPKKSKKYVVDYGYPYSSYIAFYMPLVEYYPFIDFLYKMGFESPLLYILRDEIRVNNPKDPIITKKYYDTLLYVHISGFTDDEFQIGIYVEPIHYPASQQKWDRMRDRAWERWLNLINSYQHGSYGYSSDYRHFHNRELYEIMWKED
jgi:hypothetical protein